VPGLTFADIEQRARKYMAENNVHLLEESLLNEKHRLFVEGCRRALLFLLDEWRRVGVELVFLNRPLRQSPEDDLSLQVQGIVAEYERAKHGAESTRQKACRTKRIA
jgi:hypothetical protein